MTRDNESFLSALTSLWLRLSTVAIVGLFFFLAMQLHEKVPGWTFQLTTFEILFEVVAYASFVALSGIVLGAVVTLASAPFLFYWKSSRRRIVAIVTDAGVAIAACADLGRALVHVLRAVHVEGNAETAVLVCYFIFFALILAIPRRRKQLTTSLDHFLGEKATRRAVIGTGVTAAALIVTEAAIGKVATPAIAPRGPSRPSAPNILLVTFDALCAEDMSLYGYRLPTTPHIDAFARKSSVFTNFYSGSTFTTPSIATILTGMYPSQHHIFHLNGRFSADIAAKTFPRAMRAGGYATGASITNPLAYFLTQGIAEDFDYFPEPLYRTANMQRLWDASRILHQRQPVGSRAGEFLDLEQGWNFASQQLKTYVPGMSGQTVSDFPAAGSFKQARQILDRLPDGFFLWVHVLAPHAWYLPAANLGRFLPSGDLRTAEEQNSRLYPLQYGPSRQGTIDKARLRYDEFLADADSAFGSFMSGVEAAGRLRNTTVVVSADHGECFEGGFWSHGGGYQTRPEIHIPLIVHTPGQENGSRVAVAADETSLAPTLLDLAGLPRPEWMRSPSLRPWLNRNNEGEGQGLAFTQYLEIDSIFRPLNKGTVGVIDGRDQYILDLATGKGKLRGLGQAESVDLDCSADFPDLAQTFRETIYSRFPDLPRKHA